jgi:sodium-dependent phosphate cotransporter
LFDPDTEPYVHPVVPPEPDLSPLPTADVPVLPVLRSSLRARLMAILRRLIPALAGLLAFIIALELLKQGAGVYGSQIIGLLDITTPVSALGFGWFLAYLFLSGSPVAAVAVTFFASGTIDSLQTFTMITGSRLGASFIVLFVGFLYYLRGQRRAAGIAIGVLALLTTAAIYLPALGLGYWFLSSDLVGNLALEPVSPLSSFSDWLIVPLIDWVSGLMPGWGLLILGVLLLLGAFSLLDQALPTMDPERNAFRQIGRLVYRPMAMFLLGALVTSLTLSVSVSLGILVPLSVRGLVKRENTLPYIMGANITTFIDTLLAALIIGGSAAFTIVLVEMVSVAVLSLAVLLLGYRHFERLILRLQEVIMRSRWTLGLFLGIMLITPLVLLVVPF